MKTRIKSYFTITKKEWNGLVVLVILIAGVLIAPYVYQLFHKDSAINFKDFDKEAALLDKAAKNGTYKTDSTAEDEKTAHPNMFLFDPNSLSTAQWQQLGLSSRQAAVIAHYLAKGGHFYKKEDLNKIYAITPDDYNRLETFITLPPGALATEKLKPGETIELNSADSAKLTNVPGIGPSFAVRIVRYRDRLGGFYKKDQLKEIYGIDSAKFEEISKQLTINAKLVTKLNINSISFDQLRLFPYLSYKQVNAIIEYRSQHGPYKSIADIKNIAILDESTITKIEPYLSYK